MRQFLFVCVVCLSLSACQGNKAAPSQERPAAKVEQFYRWYLGELANHAVPIVDSREKLQGYVTESLMRQLSEAADSGNLTRDYFLQVQDYPDDWLTALRVQDEKTESDSSEVNVLLGADRATHRLRVSLKRSADSWKIDRVVGSDQ